MNTGQMLAAELEHEAISTGKMLERVPADLDWSPHEKSMTLGSLATHIALLPTYVKPTLSGDGLDLDANDFSPPDFKNGAELAAAFRQNVSEAAESLKNVSDEDLTHKWRLSKGEHVIFELPRAAVLRSMVFSHLLHHRGQLSVYLRLKDVLLPGVYGPSADEQ